MFFDMLENVRNSKKTSLASGKHYLFGQLQKFGKNLVSKSECVNWRFLTARFDGKLEYFQDAWQYFYGTNARTKKRLRVVTDFDLCEPVLFKPMNTSPTVPATCITRIGMNTSFIQPKNSNKAVLVSDNRIDWLEPDNIKTESTCHQSTDSQSESSRDNIEVSSPNSTEETSVTEREQPSGATRTSSRKNKQPESFGAAIPTNLLKIGEKIWYITKIRTLNLS